MLIFFQPQKVCLSYRCADMDREIPALMGVSKAILENVIFVHQDEANWPLQDSSTLKKKFDDIFSATRYLLFHHLWFSTSIHCYTNTSTSRHLLWVWLVLIDSNNESESVLHVECVEFYISWWVIVVTILMVKMIALNVLNQIAKGNLYL